MSTTDVSIAVLQQQVKQLTTDVEELTKATNDLVKAWEAAQAFVSLVKLASALAGAAGMIWAAIRLRWP